MASCHPLQRRRRNRHGSRCLPSRVTENAASGREASNRSLNRLSSRSAAAHESIRPFAVVYDRTRLLLGCPIPVEDIRSARADLIDPCKSALDTGLKISLHSDYNTTPIGPLIYVHNAVTRLMRGTSDVLNAAERITVDQALRAVTIDAAWQCRTDGIVGSLEPGKYADLVLLAQDPHAVQPEEIINIQVNETWLAGSRRFKKTL